jgi:hypothetical protein
MAGHEEDHERDGVGYRVRVDREETGWRGSWHCRRCGVQGRTGRRRLAAGEALDAAYTHLHLHHVFSHADAASA